MDGFSLSDALPLAGQQKPRPAPRVLYGTVETSSPLAVVIDGDADPTPAVSCVGDPPVGTRVVMLLQQTVLVAIGAVGNCQYAVGDLYTTTSTTAPGDRWPGTTWEAYAAGRVLVGLDASDASFDTLGETDGAKTHTLSAAEMPSHTHLLDAGGTAGSGSTAPVRATSAAYANALITKSAGSGQAHNNLPPYIVVRIWRRTA
jgi:hypothetical protein